MRFHVDRIDQRILAYLSQYGRMTWVELSQMIHLSAPSTIDRVKKLEEEGVILGYHAKIDLDKLNLGICAFIDLAVNTTKNAEEVLSKLRNFPEVFECYKTSGPFELFLKVYCKDTKHLANFLEKSLKNICGVERAQAKIVLETCKKMAPLSFEGI